MGFGDDILVTGIVKRAALKHPGKKFAVGDGTKIHWSPVFENNPHILKEIEPGCLWVRDFPGHRAYIKASYDWGYEFNENHRASPGELFLSADDPGLGPYVYIEPNVKNTVIHNKDWGFENWQKVVDELPGVRFVQGAGRRLDGVKQLDTATFLDACRLLLHAHLFVGTDGGLHHAAAALGKRAVVVWGGFCSPRITGYDSHTNLWSGAKSCGRLEHCEHCKKALSEITVDMVVAGIRKNL